MSEVAKGSAAQDEIITFLRKRDYQLVRELGQGACGKTVLLYDDQIDEHFVCKKFTPYSEGSRQELFAGFVREIKILHQVHHKNVVRVFNYYLYPGESTGFILMEFVDGSDIEDYLTEAPEMINEVFLQTISGFRYLESNAILHRDIRPQNVMVCRDGKVKIIDFGFGKCVQESRDFNKSISLNWWCQPPYEFSAGVYDYCSEVYFVGKLFERIIQDNDIDQFEYKAMLGNMCQHKPETRVKSFADIEKEIQSNRFFEVGFSDDEISSYREFSGAIAEHITKIENKTKYQYDVERVETALENTYRNFMLEETVPQTSLVTKCLISGQYYCMSEGFKVRTVRGFLQLLKSTSLEKKRIILSNLHTRLDAITRYEEPGELDSTIPF